jgi:hypothetical protein
MKLVFHSLNSVGPKVRGYDLNAWRSSFNGRALCLSLILILGFPVAAGAVERGELFATPEDAVAALKGAVASQDTADLRRIFGPEAEDIQNPDRVQATNDLAEFADALNTKSRIVRESDTKYVVEAGTNSWPFPVPIVQTNGGWYFDTAAGKDEILNRRIGKNELEVLDTMRAYVDAQREYAGQYRNGNDVLEYAQKLASTPGKQDGLYWPPDLDGQMSPLGPLVADAQTEGYKVKAQGQETTRAPFHGYYFKILRRQGKDAPGGKYDYVINGHMIAGFGLVAWPADYGNSGIMTFIVNQQGRVYQRDLGPKTEKLAPAINAYDPGPGWSPSPD